MRILSPEEIIASGKFPELRELTSEELKEAYALSKAYFTEEHLACFTDPDDDGTPLEEVLKELEEAQEQFDATSP